VTSVWASTDQLRSLASHLADRRAMGLDRYDEWWDGVHRAVTGPAPDHQELVAEVFGLFLPLGRNRGLKVTAGINIGVDKRDCRVPDLAAYRPDTERTSRAFLATAELVVEVLSPDEPAGAKLDFYAEWHVGEYLEIDPGAGSARLLRRCGERWEPAAVSAVLGFAVEPGALAAGDQRLELPAGGA
jgi:hypothetical protein